MRQRRLRRRMLRHLSLWGCMPCASSACPGRLRPYNDKLVVTKAAHV
ncbi:hypothetical protein SAMN04487768_1190 [Burkholderia sp. b13]|nr:hypothetical protein SAMN04487768_1190 [Burkholderia sp. b13]